MPDPRPEAAFLAGDGEMARRIRAHDWASTPIGAVDSWPASLRTMVRMALTTQHPVFIFWGPQHICLYNDAYAPSIGPEKHPGILGRPAREAWAEIWHIIGPQIDQVLRGDGSTWHENQLVPILRHGELQDVYWTYSYGPIDEAAAPKGVGGVLVLVTETTRHVLAERRLASEHERLLQLFEQAPIFAAIVSGPPYVFELANPGYRALVGDRDVVGRRLDEVLPEAVEQGYLELLDRTYRSGRPYIAQGARFRLRGADGSTQERTVDFVYQPIIDATGATARIFVAGVDVSARVEAQRALAFREEQLRLATDAGDIGLWDVDLVHETLFWPARVKAMFGISPERPVTLADFYDGLHPDDRAHTTEAFAAAVDPARRAVYDVEYRTVGKEDGVERWVAARGRAIFDDDGRCLRCVGAAIDITGRKSAEARLRELNETLERRLSDYLAERKTLLEIVDGSDVGVQALGPDLRFIAINRAVADQYHAIWGFRPAVGDSLTALLGSRPEALSAATALWKRALAGEEFTEIQEFGDGHRERRWYEMRFNPLFDPQGRRIGAYQIAYDVTERLRQQARLDRAELALRQTQKMEAVGLLTGGIAHDFNNLLQAIRGNFELIRRLGDDPRRTREIADKGVDVTKRGARLTAQLLSFSREQSLDVQAVDVGALLRGMEDLLRTTVGGGVQLTLDPGDAPLWALADPTQLDMALLNLAINARDAMPQGGELRLSVRAAAREAGAAPPRGEAVEIRAADTGLGMTADVVARAFEPFFTTKPVGSGSGLGLAQVYGMAERAGGSVRLDSEPGRGTAVVIRLPHAAESLLPTATPRAEPGPQAGPGRSATVLLVDDDADVRRLIGTALRSFGYNVLQAVDGPSGLEQLDAGPVDLLLLDFAMPGMDGATMARAAHRRHPELPIVLISGYSDSEAIDATIRDGALLLRKPFGLDTLRDVVEMVLARSAASAPR
ncbi:MAG: PAS domain-containing protein [Rubrivivax sp.]